MLSHFTTSPREPSDCATGAPEARAGHAAGGCPSRIRTSPNGFKVRCPTTRRRGNGRQRTRPVPARGQKNGAEDGTRTRDPHLGKVMLYQLSHFRSGPARAGDVGAESQSRTGDTAIFSRVLYQLSYLGPASPAVRTGPTAWRRIARAPSATQSTPVVVTSRPRNFAKRSAAPRSAARSSESSGTASSTSSAVARAPGSSRRRYRPTTRPLRTTT